jgi:hypothetical protein
LSFALKMKNYDDLRTTSPHVPVILVVLCVPSDTKTWLNEKLKETAMRRCAYWSSIRGAPEVKNETSKTVLVPRAQRFTVDALMQIMTRIGAGGIP